MKLRLRLRLLLLLGEYPSLRRLSGGERNRDLDSERDGLRLLGDDLRRSLGGDRGAGFGFSAGMRRRLDGWTAGLAARLGGGERDLLGDRERDDGFAAFPRGAARRGGEREE